MRRRPEPGRTGRAPASRPAPARTAAPLAAVVARTRRHGEVVRRRVRSPLARRAIRNRAGAAVVALAVAAGVGRLVGDAEAARTTWGRTVQVAVVRGDHDAGDEVRTGSVELREWPAGLVPHTALHALPEGRRFATDVVDGELLVAGRIARAGSSSAAARLPEGRAAVTVPLGPAPPPLEVGDLVDVLAPPAARGEPWEAAAEVPAEVVAASAEVVGVQDGHATLVVDRADVEGTAAAILAGTLTLVLIG